jgi:alkylation response protein AidB-like acyl-CoA dehydrogenase
VAEVREVLEAGADQSEEEGTLPQDSVDALYESGLLGLKLPAELGGAEADPVTQLEVIEALARIDASAAWCTMIGATSMGSWGAFLPDGAIEQLFVGGRPPKGAGVFLPAGIAVPKGDGYIVNSRWPFASGIRHSEYVSGGVRVARDGVETGERLRMVFPTSDVKIHDNWQVSGLRGTGSNDYSVTELFVPKEFSWDPIHTPPKRGGPLFRMGSPGLVANEHSAFALGVGRRVLDAIVGQSTETRGWRNPEAIASRQSFQRSLGWCDLRLRAARSLVVEILERAWESACDGITPDLQLQIEMRSSATYAAEVAVEVASQAFRYGGGRALYNSSVLQRCLRDLNAAAQHFMVSDSSYENHGQFMLGMPDIDPMG